MDNAADKSYFLTMSEQVDDGLLPQAKEMLGSFSSLLGVRIAFFSTSGGEIFSGLGRPVCDYCRRLRRDPSVDAACRALDARMCDRAGEQRKPVCYTCHGGLTEVVLPAILSGQCVGFLMIGQFRTRGQAHSPPSGGVALHSAYRQTPEFSREQIGDMIRMLELMVEFIVGHTLIRIRDLDLIHPLIDELAKHPERAITIREAAARVGRSPSGFSHLFKRLTGEGFRQYQIRLRLNEADRLLRAFPRMPIKEVAVRSGFSDPLYFSRLYRKRRGYSPSSASSCSAWCTGMRETP